MNIRFYMQYYWMALAGVIFLIWPLAFIKKIFNFKDCLIHMGILESSCLKRLVSGTAMP